MKVLVSYVDFHWGNHQGGEGKSFQFQVTIDVPPEIFAAALVDYIKCQVLSEAKKSRPFDQSADDRGFAIQRMELV